MHCTQCGPRPSAGVQQHMHVCDDHFGVMKRSKSTMRINKYRRNYLAHSAVVVEANANEWIVPKIFTHDVWDIC